MLDPQMRHRTATPRAYPAGRHRRETFHNGGQLRAAAYSKLDASAMQLTGMYVGSDHKSLGVAASLPGERRIDRFVCLLMSPDGRKIFERYGFQ